ncbi:MAG: hypothetical protein AUJ52_10630 [Elusimicrobia bacterium CG1_02_63_36]|nr:MAG: hypothetical protein AUJ52_10630 [Elusimicrobia bacterium CG1_02_63_36]PIP83982.1 MAG: hypothetical protein COR54_06730 [Elusimicrobia bacterium CG22_combo_CG10-13_8_21_14_all_63_91]PJA17279.1 MAG: hypothetical protein COX66_05180 [Elusimicrobia bacterium CG_4_10_14_0_2_um_filter_63_34]PJB23840.1 MAG: hypothetical protein CO113_16485 [Elusimicrobia bacterium CG_4_9_14_3_um_filter_62_55]
MKRFLSLIALALIAAAPAGAISNRAGTSGAAFLKLGAGSRAGAMAESYSAVAGDVSAIYYNPAALTRLTKSELLAAHTEHFQGIGYEVGMFAYPFGRGEKSSKNVLGFAVYNLGVSDIQRRTGDTDAPIGSFSAGDYAYTLSGAHRVSERVSVGGNGKYIHQTIDSFHADAFALDAAVLYTPYPKAARPMHFSAVLKNFGTKVKFAGITDPLPAGFTLGWGMNITPKSWMVNADLTKYNDTDPFLAIGTQYRRELSEAIAGAFRAGFTTHRRENPGFNELTLGAGLEFHRAAFDFAWVPFGDLGNTFRFSVIVKF